MKSINHFAAALGLMFAALSATSASAAIITYDFEVKPTAGPLAGATYSGWFSYNDAVLTNSGKDQITVFNGGLNVRFSFEGFPYVTSDDQSYALFPEVTFQDGTLLGLSFLVSNIHHYFAIGASDINFDDGGSDFAYVDSELEQLFSSLDAVTYSLRGEDPNQGEIPEPTTLALLGAGLAGIGVARRRKSRAN